MRKAMQGNISTFSLFDISWNMKSGIEISKIASCFLFFYINIIRIQVIMSVTVISSFTVLIFKNHYWLKLDSTHPRSVYWFKNPRDQNKGRLPSLPWFYSGEINMLTVFCWFKPIWSPQATNNLRDICRLAMSWQTETMWMNTQWLHCSPLPCSSSNTLACHHSVSLETCFYSEITPWTINRGMATGQCCDDTGNEVNQFSFLCFILTMAGLSKQVKYTIKGVVAAGGSGWFNPFFNVTNLL